VFARQRNRAGQFCGNARFSDLRAHRPFVPLSYLSSHLFSRPLPPAASVVATESLLGQSDIQGIRETIIRVIQSAGLTMLPRIPGERSLSHDVCGARNVSPSICISLSLSLSLSLPLCSSFLSSVCRAIRSGFHWRSLRGCHLINGTG